MKTKKVLFLDLSDRYEYEAYIADIPINIIDDRYFSWYEAIDYGFIPECFINLIDKDLKYQIHNTIYEILEEMYDKYDESFPCDYDESFPCDCEPEPVYSDEEETHFEIIKRYFLTKFKFDYFLIQEDNVIRHIEELN